MYLQFTPKNSLVVVPSIDVENYKYAQQQQNNTTYMTLITRKIQYLYPRRKSEYIIILLCPVNNNNSNNNNNNLLVESIPLCLVLLTLSIMPVNIRYRFT